MLFSSATDAEVPWMKGAYTWQANINATIKRDKKKGLKPVRHMQMDIGVKEWDSGNSGWVLGTLVYNPDATVAQAGGDSPWHKMMPVGLAWGNDETNLEAKPVTPLLETKIAKNVPPHAAKTMGFGGRLNGPADNPRSACFSCHGAAQFQSNTKLPASPMVYPPFTTKEARGRWFRTIRGADYDYNELGEPFDPGQSSMDYSLQLAIAFRNFYKTGGLE